MENVEIKVRIKNFSAILAKLRTLKARRCGLLVQRDTYFACPNGRLKLREFPGKPAQLILYNRAERSADRLSRFHILEIRNPAAFTAFLRRIFPVWAVVSKKRELYYVKTARIHLDRVRGLGSFLEIESEVKRGRASARKLLAELMRQLGLSRGECIRKSYSDLLAAKKRR